LAASTASISLITFVVNVEVRVPRRPSAGDRQAASTAAVRGRPSEAGWSGTERDRRADDRDERATRRDDQAVARDVCAQARDDRAEAREELADVTDPAAAADRAGAARDRRDGATDRGHAADDREAASADRAVSATEREESSIDGLTSAYRREAGMLALERDIARTKRTRQPFTLAFVDVDNLKAANLSGGHAAGDHVLRTTVAAIRRHLRTYDLVVRFGGDEFLCGMMDVTADQAARRFSRVNEALAAERASVTVGIAELDGDGDACLDDLIALADAAMYDERARHRPLRRFGLAPAGPDGGALPVLDLRPDECAAPAGPQLKDGRPDAER
jgi:diguanylate cyclase (GGDEF)-like protein